MMTLHPVEDEAKVEALAASMEVVGWQGAPLVHDGDWLITGVHRSAAAERAGVEPELVDIRDLFAQAGRNFDEDHIAWGAPTIVEDDYRILIEESLPAELRAEYGIDRR